MDAGTGDGGLDGGPADAGSDGGVTSNWCNGTHCYDNSGGVTFGTPGPWPQSNEQFTAAQGIQESPVVGATTDEAQNLWVATANALYLLKPGQTTFHRFTAGDGLHLQSNPVVYCDTWAPAPPGPPPAGSGIPYYPYQNCPITGAADAAGITEIVGGGPNEVFVGYAGAHHFDDPYDGTYLDGLRHSGKLDRVRVATDNTLLVDRFDMVSGNTPQFWHNRYVWKMLFDHLIHPHDLYVGTDHGVDRITPDKFRYPLRGEFFHQVTLEYMADHLHPEVCYHQYCRGDQYLRMGDWRGLALSLDGNLWVGGRWAAGEIIWTAINSAINPATGQLDGAGNTGWAQRGGNALSPPFAIAFGDPYCGTAGQWVTGYDSSNQPIFASCSPSDGPNRPVFLTPYEGDIISISAVTVTPNDGLAWFASGAAYDNSNNWGVASWNEHPAPGVAHWTYYDPIRDLGMSEANVHDMLALPDGRIAFAGADTGIVIWNPATHVSTPMRGSQWLPDDHVNRMELDTMVNPPALHVATDTGAVTIRQLP